MIKKILITIVGILKSFWNATIKTTLGIVSIYLLAGIIRGMDIDASRITDLLTMSIILIKYWIIFWFAFFARSLYNELKFEVID